LDEASLICTDFIIIIFKKNIYFVWHTQKQFNFPAKNRVHSHDANAARAEKKENHPTPLKN
jgi:hypothetical protein